MATTTTNYGFDIPQSTDLVKDGATAIATLGQDIDTAMNTALGTKKAGMVLLNTTSFSGVSSVTLATNTFNANYLNYEIHISITSASVQAGMSIRMTNSGTPVTTANYDRSNIYLAPSTGATWTNESSGDNQTSFIMAGYNTTGGAMTFRILNPFATENTLFSALNHTSTNGFYASGGRVSTTTSYDALQFFPGSGNITGSYSVYGYNI